VAEANRKKMEDDITTTDNMFSLSDFPLADIPPMTDWYTDSAQLGLSDNEQEPLPVAVAATTDSEIPPAWIEQLVSQTQTRATDIKTLDETLSTRGPRGPGAVDTSEMIVAEAVRLYQSEVSVGLSNHPLFIERLRLQKDDVKGKLNTISVHTHPNWAVNLALLTALRLSQIKQNSPFTTLDKQPDGKCTWEFKNDVARTPRIIFHVINRNLTGQRLRQLVGVAGQPDKKQLRQMAEYPAKDFLARLPLSLFTKTGLQTRKSLLGVKPLSSEFPFPPSRCCPYILEGCDNMVRDVSLRAASDHAVFPVESRAKGLDLLDLRMLDSKNGFYDIRFVFDAELSKRATALTVQDRWKDLSGSVNAGDIYFLDLPSEDLKFAAKKGKAVDRCTTIHNMQFRVDFYFSVSDEMGYADQMVDVPASVASFLAHTKRRPVENGKGRMEFFRKSVDCSGNPILNPEAELENMPEHLNFKCSLALQDIPDISEPQRRDLKAAEEKDKVRRLFDQKQRWIGVGYNAGTTERRYEAVFARNSDIEKELSVAPVTLVFTGITSHPMYDCSFLNRSLATDPGAFLGQPSILSAVSGAELPPDPQFPHLVSTHAGVLVPRAAEFSLYAIHDWTLVTNNQRRLIPPLAFRFMREPRLTKINQFVSGAAFDSYNASYFVVDCLHGALIQRRPPGTPEILDASAYNLHGCAAALFWLLMDRRFQRTMGRVQWQWAAEWFLDLTLLDNFMQGEISIIRLIRNARKQGPLELDKMHQEVVHLAEAVFDNKAFASYFHLLFDVLTTEMASDHFDDSPALSEAHAALYFSTFRRALAGVSLIFADRLGVLHARYAPKDLGITAAAWFAFRSNLWAAHEKIVSLLDAKFPSGPARVLWRSRQESPFMCTETLSHSIHTLHSLGIFLQTDDTNDALLGSATRNFCLGTVAYSGARGVSGRSYMIPQFLWMCYLHPMETDAPIPFDWQFTLPDWMNKTTVFPLAKHLPLRAGFLLMAWHLGYDVPPEEREAASGQCFQAAFDTTDAFRQFHLLYLAIELLRDEKYALPHNLRGAKGYEWLGPLVQSFSVDQGEVSVDPDVMITPERHVDKWDRRVYSNWLLHEMHQTFMEI
jgi:hypothetical protein